MEILFNPATGRFEVWTFGAEGPEFEAEGPEFEAEGPEFEAEDFGRCITYRMAMREAGLC